MSFNLKEYILYRTEIRRELFNAEVDTNFKMVANPWVDSRVYEEGHIVYHPVIIENAITTTGTPVNPTGTNNQSLAWWRANKRTTKGVFLLDEWDLIGGVGTGDISVRGADGFGKVLVNYTGPTGSFQGGADGLLSSPNPNATINYIAGPGMQLQWDQTSNSIKFINVTAGGEVNHGLNIGTGLSVYDGLSGTDLQFRGFSSSNTSGNPALTSAVNLFTSNINYNLDTSQILLGELSGGNPTADELSDITYPSGLPSNGDLLQWSSSSGSWLPVPTSLLGVNNIYDNSATIGSTNRTVTLNSNVGGFLKFQSAVGTNGLSINNAGNSFTLGGNLGTYLNTFLDLRPNNTDKIQIRLDQLNALGNAVMSFGNESVIPGNQFFVGFNTSSSIFGIVGGTAYTGLTTISTKDKNALSVGGSKEIYIPDLTQVPTFTPPFGIEHYLPFAENTTQGLDSRGRLRSDVDLFWTYDGTSGTASSAKQFSINYYNGGPYITPTEKAGLWVKNVPTSTETETYSIFSSTQEWGGKALPDILVGIHSELNEKLLFGKSIDSRINILDNTESLTLGYSVLSGFETNISSSRADVSHGIIINSNGTSSTQYGATLFWGTSSTPTSKIGIFSDVVSTYTNKFGINENNETWSGLFKGCVAVKDGGLVLDTFTSTPSCNTTPTGEIPYEDRTLWINETNGHLYRGSQDIEASIGGSFKTVLASSSFYANPNFDFAQEPYLPNTLTDFSIGGGYNPLNSPPVPGVNASAVWTNAYTFDIKPEDGSIGYIDPSGFGCLINVPYNLNAGQYLKLQALVRLDYSVGSFTFNPLVNLFKMGVFKINTSNFFDTTGFDSSIEVLKTNTYQGTQNDPYATFIATMRFSLTNNLSAVDDKLAVGFGLVGFADDLSNSLSVSWTLSASDS